MVAYYEHVSVLVREVGSVKSEVESDLLKKIFVSQLMYNSTLSGSATFIHNVAAPSQFPCTRPKRLLHVSCQNICVPLYPKSRHLQHPPPCLALDRETTEGPDPIRGKQNWENGHFGLRFRSFSHSKIENEVENEVVFPILFSPIAFNSQMS